MTRTWLVCAIALWALSLDAIASVQEHLQDAVIVDDECDAASAENGKCSLAALQTKSVNIELEEGENSTALLQILEDNKDLMTDPQAQVVVDEVNERFNAGDKGVYMRLVYGAQPQPWFTFAPTQSFALLNKYAWNTRTSEITIFSFHGPSSGYIAKPSAMDVPGMLKCAFPCDGFSDHRKIGHKGCGCVSNVDCSKPGESDWCDDYPGNTGNGALEEMPFRARGIPCAFKPSQTAKMLATYKAVKTETAPKNLSSSCDTWGQGAAGHNAWTEVVCDSTLWRKSPGDYIEAMVVPSNCKSSLICRNNFYAWYMRFRWSFGKRPVLVLDLKKERSPFSLWY